MAAILIYRSKYVYADGALREMVLWKVTKKVRQSEHDFKYRLYYGLPDGTCLVRYDNEQGKGDHRHRAGREEKYRFKDVETLVRDFMNDIDRARGGRK